MKQYHTKLRNDICNYIWEHYKRTGRSMESLRNDLYIAFKKKLSLKSFYRIVAEKYGQKRTR